jgi:3-oxoacyl-[acyl-carrier-protein] synthase III
MCAFITNTATFLPNDPVDNDQIESILGMIGGRPSRSRKLILRSNGILQRYYAINPQTGLATHTNAKMTACAVKRLFDSDAQLSDIDCLVSGTSMPDQTMPSHAVMVHGELQNVTCEVVSTAGICLSGVSSLKYAFMGVKSGEFQTAVSTGSELASQLLQARNFEAESTHKVDALERHPEIAFDKDFLRWMLSDGAGAFRIEANPIQRADQPVFEIEWIDIASYANELNTCMYAGANKLKDGSLKGWCLYNQQELISQSVLNVKQDVKLLNENIVPITLTRSLAKSIHKHALKSDQIDWFLPHISSMYFYDRVYEALAEMGFEIPRERWFTNLDRYGNTGSASIYIILDELAKSGRLKSGQKLLCFVPESGRFSSSFMLLSVV